MKIKYLGTSFYTLTTNKYYSIEYTGIDFYVINNYGHKIYYDAWQMLTYFEITEHQLNKLKIFSS